MATRRSIRHGAAVVAVAAAALAAFVLVWFQPQKLFIDDRVDEALPAAPMIDLPDGRRYVRFERFHTSNGPLLRVYLSAAAPDGPGGSFDDRFVDLGALKGNIGDQNYAVPGRTRLAAYRSVVVWCKRFGVPFAAARVMAR